MARLWQGGAELNSTANGVEVTTNSSIAISSTTFRSGLYAWRANPASSTSSVRHNVKTSNTSSSVFVRAYVYIASYPLATSGILNVLTTGNVLCGGIALDSAGHLLLKNAANAQIGSNSSVLSLNTWYRVEINMDASSSPGTVTGQLDGTQFATGANSAQSAWGRVTWGILTSTTADIYIDDVAVNDATGASQTSWPGSGKIIHLKPNAAGDSNTFGTAVGGTAGASNAFTRVDEVTPDDITSYNASNTLNQEDLFLCNASGIASNSTVSTVLVGVRAANITTADATTAYKLEVMKVTGGTKLQSAATKPNSTTWSTPGWLLITTADPDSGVWTQSTLDTMQIGYILSTANVNSIGISTIYASIEYIPGIVVASHGSTLGLLGVG